MKTKAYIIGLLVVVLLATAFPLSVSQVEASLGTIYVTDNYPTIQEAVDYADAGDTIIVRDGTYTENVDVNKDHLTIESENGAETTTVQAANPGDHVFEITADYVTISGFTVTGATGSDKAGIYLNYTDHCEISNDMISNSSYGIYLSDSSYNSIASNIVESCAESGIILDYSPTPGPYLSAVGHNDPDDEWIDEPLAYDGDTDTFASVYLSGGRDSSWLELLAPAGKLTQGIRFWGSGGPLQVDIYYDGNWYCLKDWAWGISSAPANQWVELTYSSKIVEKARIKFHGRVLSGWSYLNEFQFKTTPSDYAGSDADGDGIGDTPYSIDGDNDNYPLMEPFENYEIGPAPNQPPVADAALDQSVSSGQSVYFDASNSYDPDGTIISYQWDSGDGDTATGCAVSHRFRGAMNTSKTYTVTLTVEDNEGAVSTDTTDVEVAPLEITVPIYEPIPLTPKFANMTVFYNWVEEIDGQNVYIISKIHLEGEGYVWYTPSVWDAHSHRVPLPIWSKKVVRWFGAPVDETFVSPFRGCNPRYWELVFYDGDYFEGLKVYSFDVMQLMVFGLAGAPGVRIAPYMRIASVAFE